MAEKKTRERKEKQAKVVLHGLAGTKKALDACRLVERLYQSGKRVTVFLADRGRASMFDDYLWTFAQNSFVPHAIWDGQGEASDPVVVVTGTLSNPNGADVLVIGDRLADPADASAFSEIHDFVTTSPEDQGKAKAWEAAGFDVTEPRASRKQS
jgi:DNA polymerase-3 subunit chi